MCGCYLRGTFTRISVTKMNRNDLTIFLVKSRTLINKNSWIYQSICRSYMYIWEYSIWGSEIFFNGYSDIVFSNALSINNHNSVLYINLSCKFNSLRFYLVFKFIINSETQFVIFVIFQCVLHNFVYFYNFLSYSFTLQLFSFTNTFNVFISFTIAFSSINVFI